MTYPDDVLKAAREAAIRVYHDAHKGDVYYDPRRYEARFRSGECDDDYTVEAACMAERLRCAGIALNPGFIQARDTEWDEGVSYAKRFIHAAILSQQEQEA